ncbi:hypothetical protein K7432_003938 [Basidiobolus ranarum]|uniref:PH domain-containing protein n=1 Tax=Basidiobolus ranarum TaxID=34480 RepID=A0ABR2WZ44_9FUNG
MSLSKRNSIFGRRTSNEVREELTSNPSELLPSDIFEQRLYAWKSTIKQLIFYFQTIAETEQQSARGYSKAFSSMQVPLKEGHHLLPVGSNGVQDVAAAVNSTTQQLVEYHTEFARCITDQTVGNLTRLKTEIKSRLLSTKKDLINHETNLGRERQNSAKLISEYDQACYTADGHSSPNGKPGPMDPWLVYNNLQKQLSKQIFEENSFHKTMLSTQKSLEIFEASIIETLKNTLESYYKWRSANITKILEQINMANEVIAVLSPAHEWNAFFEKNKPPLIDPDSPETSIEAISYPNKDHPLTVPLKYGVMERQGGVFKSVKRDHCFLTSSGFLHGYPNSDPTAGSPEFSIYLPSSVMRGYSESNIAFEIAEKGSGGLFHRAEHTYVFRFLKREDLNEWWGAIREFTKTTEETPFNSNSQPTSPVVFAAGGGNEGTEPTPLNSRATTENIDPAVLAQASQPATAETINQRAIAEESQQPISSALQQSQYTISPQQSSAAPATTPVQQQIPYTANENLQQQPQYTGLQNQQQQPPPLPQHPSVQQQQQPQQSSSAPATTPIQQQTLNTANENLQQQPQYIGSQNQQQQPPPLPQHPSVQQQQQQPQQSYAAPTTTPAQQQIPQTVNENSKQSHQYSSEQSSQQQPTYPNNQGQVQQQPQYLSEQNPQQNQGQMYQQLQHTDSQGLKQNSQFADPPQQQYQYPANLTQQQPSNNQAPNPQAVIYDSTQAIPRDATTLQSAPSNADTLAGVPGQMPGQLTSA